MDISHAISTALNALPNETTFAVAFSGGLDSTVLLHAAVAHAGAAHCIAFHVHHGLSPHANAWLAHCDVVARTLGVHFIPTYVKLNNLSAQGIEAAARNARYQALGELCADHQIQVVLLGHHADDQAETVLLQLLRGAGPAGIAAMPKKRLMLMQTMQTTVHAITLLRPFLALPRTTMKAYAVQHHLQWIEDESNQNWRYPRNTLRHGILPAIAAQFPAYRKTLARAACHAAEAQALLDELAEIDFFHMTNLQSVCRLSRHAFLKLSFPRAANLVRYWMRRLGLPTASSAWIDQLLKQLYHQPNDTPWYINYLADYRFYAYRDQIGWETVKNIKHMVADDPLGILQWSGETAWDLARWGGQLLFTEQHVDEGIPTARLRLAPLRALARRGGERLRRSVRGPRRTLKNLFQEVGLPAWRRNVPLIYLGQQLLFVPYIGLNYDTVNPIAEHEQHGAQVSLIWHPYPTRI